MKTQLAWQLLSKTGRTKTGRPKVASANGTPSALAAAVLLGLSPSDGIHGLLPRIYGGQIKRLLKNNYFGLVKRKTSTLQKGHANQRLRDELYKAWSGVIGPLYVEQPTFNPKAPLQPRKIARWVKASIENPGSELNRRLKNRGYEQLPELIRTQRWWEDRLRE